MKHTMYTVIFLVIFLLINLFTFSDRNTFEKLSNFQEYFHNDKGLNALHFAAMIGEHELVKILFEKDMALNTKDSYGRTPLNFAAQNGHWLICLYLIEYGEEKNPSNENGKLVSEELNLFYAWFFQWCKKMVFCYHNCSELL